MGAAAQVFKITFAVQADLLVCWNAADDLGLVMLAQGFEVRNGFVTWQHAAQDGFVFGRQLGHALFYRRQVLRREGAAVRKIVIKAVINDRANGDLSLGKQGLDGIRQQVGGRVTDQLQTFGVFGGHDRQLRVGGDAEAGVHQLTIDLAAQCGLGQACPNRGRHFGHRDRARKLAQ